MSDKQRYIIRGSSTLEEKLQYAAMVEYILDVGVLKANYRTFLEHKDKYFRPKNIINRLYVDYVLKLYNIDIFKLTKGFTFISNEFYDKLDDYCYDFSTGELIETSKLAIKMNTVILEPKDLISSTIAKHIEHSKTNNSIIYIKLKDLCDVVNKSNYDNGLWLNNKTFKSALTFNLVNCIVEDIYNTAHNVTLFNNDIIIIRIDETNGNVLYNKNEVTMFFRLIEFLK